MSNPEATAILTALNPLTQEIRVLPQVTFFTPRRDPVAQTFDVTADTLVTGVELFFSSKPTGAVAEQDSSRLTVQIRETIAGLPVSNSALAEKSLMPHEIKVSSNGTISTMINFPDPAICMKGQEYAIVVMTSSDKYRLYKATIGENTIVPTGSTPQRIGSQQSIGVMLTSANGRTWTPDQLSDLKFRLEKGTIYQTATLGFDPVVFAQPINSLHLYAMQTVPEKTDVKWKYTTNKGESGFLEPNGNPTPLLSPATTVSIEALMSTTNTDISPVIVAGSVNLKGFRNRNEGVYVSRTIPVPTGTVPTNIKVQLDMNLPSNTNVVVEYGMTDNNSIVWTTMAPPASPTGMTSNTGFYTYTFDSGASVTGATANRNHVKIRIRLIAATNGNEIVAVPKIMNLAVIVS